MLVITRRAQETVELGGEIRVTVLEIRPDRVRLGVLAPPQVKVVRSELLEQVRQSNQKAARLQPEELLAWLKPATLTLPVRDPERSSEYYCGLGFEIRPEGGLQKGPVRLQLKRGTPVPFLSFAVTPQPAVWVEDPDGYRVGLP